MAFIRVPYWTNGLPLTITPPAGYTKVADYPPGTYLPPIQGAVIQTDDYFVDGTINAWSDDGSTQKSLSHAQQKAWVNGTDNLWIKWHDTKDQAEFAVQDPFDKVYSAEELQNYIDRFGGTPNGGHI